MSENGAGVEKGPDVFLSYSRNDLERVRWLVAQIESWGLNVWRDEDDIAAVGSWRKQIMEAIDGCQVFLLAASNHSYKSDNVAKEVLRAGEKNKARMVVRLEPVEASGGELAYELIGLQYVELFGEQQAASLEKIRRYLCPDSDQDAPSDEPVTEAPEPESAPANPSLSETTLRPSDLGQAEVFISYSRRDVERVRELEEELVSWGVGVWKDTEDIGAASSWSEEIVNAIRGCKVFLLLCSNRSFASENVANEVALATSSKRVLLPVYLEPIEEVPAKFAYQLSRIQHVQYFGEHIDKALTDIRKCLRKYDIAAEGRKGGAKTSSTRGKSRSPLLSARNLGVAAALSLALVIGVVFLPGIVGSSSRLEVELPNHTLAKRAGNKVEIIDVDGNVVHSIVVGDEPVVFSPILTNGEKVLGGEGPLEPVRLGEEGAFRIELRTEEGIALASYPKVLATEEVAGRIPLEVVGSTFIVQIPNNEELRKKGWRVLIRTVDENGEKGEDVHELVGSGSDTAVFDRIVTAVEPAPGDWEMREGEPIILGKKTKVRVHIYQSEDDTSVGSGRYYQPFEGGWLPQVLLDQSPLDMSAFHNRSFGNE